MQILVAIIVKLLPWLAWLVVSVLAVYLLGLLAHVRRGLPPGPRPLPLIGSLHLLGSLPHRSLARLAETHGPILSLRLGSVTTVVVSSSAIAREFMQKQDAVFAARPVPDALRDHARNSVPWLPHTSPRWRALRRIMTSELFAAHRLDELRHLRREKVRDLADHVRRLAREGVAVDVNRVAFATSLNLISRTIFSRDVVAGLDDPGRSKEFREVIAEIMEVAGKPNLSDFFPWVAAVDLLGRRRRMGRLLRRLHRTFNDEIDQRLDDGRRRASRPRKNDFLDHLLDAAASGENVAAGLDRATLLSMFTDLFTAGSDTSSNTVEWAMVELLRNPASMADARDELAVVTGGSRRNIEESEISRLPYLQAVIRETFRLHPPAPLLLPRRAEETTEIAGYVVPKGARVLVNVWAMGRDKGAWPEPERFLPERFLERAAAAAGAVDFRGGGDFELIPFGAGRRICPGIPLAVRMVHLVLGSLLNQFEWILPTDVDRNGPDILAEKFGVTLVKAVPLCAVATPL